MTAFSDLTASFTGWGAVISGRADAGRHFRFTRAGLLVAAGWFLIAILLSIAVQSVLAAVAPTPQVLFGVVAELVTLTLLGVALRQVLIWLKSDISALTLLVPATYALAYLFVVSILLALLSNGLGVIALLAVAAMIGRAAQVLGGLKPGPAAGVAGVCVLVLVIVPNALYMLLLLFPTA